MLPYASPLMLFSGAAALLVAAGASPNGADTATLDSMGAKAGDLLVGFSAAGPLRVNGQALTTVSPGGGPTGWMRVLTASDIAYPITVDSSATHFAFHVYRGAASMSALVPSGFTPNARHAGVVMAAYSPQSMTPTVTSPSGSVQRNSSVTTLGSVGAGSKRLMTFNRLSPPASPLPADTGFATNATGSSSIFELIAL